MDFEDDISELIEQQNEIANRIREEDAMAREQESDHTIIVDLRSKLANKDAEIERLQMEVARLRDAWQQEINRNCSFPLTCIDSICRQNAERMARVFSPAPNWLNEKLAGVYDECADYLTESGVYEEDNVHVRRMRDKAKALRSEGK